MINLLWSDYIIDGFRMDSRPGEMLANACGQESDAAALGPFDAAVDESVDPAPDNSSFTPSRISRYLEAVLAQKRSGIPEGLAAPYTRAVLARTLIDAIWNQGHFRLGDLVVSAAWQWNEDKVGNLAAFFESVSAACDYLENLGIRLKDYSVTRGTTCSVSFKVSLDRESGLESWEPDPEEAFDADGTPGEGLLTELPLRTARPRMAYRRKCPALAAGDPRDWLVYIPFDTGVFRLGGSLLALASGQGCGKAPDILDPDYFIDCFEVVRELIEDGIAAAGVTVGDGGLLAALRRIVPEELGLRAEIGGIRASYAETDPVRILFSEVPGVVLEIRDADYDYLDAELLLQDVAYYPLGHIRKSQRGVLPVRTDPSDITGILQALLDSQASEGED